MGTTRLKLYNGALTLVGERAISTLTDNVEGRRLLDNEWNDNAVNYCLEQGQWKFAMCAAHFTYDTSITPPFGYRRAFAKPSDWIVTSALCVDEFFRVPLTMYSDEVGYWFSDVDDIYVRYVSNGATYGGDLTRWPATFCEYVKAYLASKIVKKLTADEKRREELLRKRTGILDTNLLIAKNKDAMADPPKWPAQGKWTRSRQGGRYRGRFGDGGSSGSLIG